MPFWEAVCSNHVKRLFSVESMIEKASLNVKFPDEYTFDGFDVEYLIVDYQYLLGIGVHLIDCLRWLWLQFLETNFIILKLFQVCTLPVDILLIPVANVVVLEIYLFQLSCSRISCFDLFLNI